MARVATLPPAELVSTAASEMAVFEHVSADRGSIATSMRICDFGRESLVLTGQGNLRSRSATAADLERLQALADEMLTALAALA